MYDQPIEANKSQAAAAAAVVASGARWAEPLSHSVDAWFAVTIDRQTVRGMERDIGGYRKRRKERLMEGNRDGVEEWAQHVVGRQRSCQSSCGSACLVTPCQPFFRSPRTSLSMLLSDPSCKGAQHSPVRVCLWQFCAHRELRVRAGHTQMLPVC